MPVASDAMTFEKAGANRSLDGLYLTEEYAVPEQECWGLTAFFGSCSIKAERSASHFDMGSGLVYDVLPATLDGFYELTPKGDGWALAWGQEGDLKFDTLYDADGDGLSHIDDPDDSKWDADDDGLSDAYEINTGSDPKSRDGDNDGLTDLQEARLGTNPASKDGDGDGLFDCQEVFHEVVAVGDEVVRQACGDVVGDWSGGWTFLYSMSGTPALTLVTSDPTQADSDADSLTDRQEYVYGFNPRVWSNANVLSFSSQLSELNGGVYEPTDWYVSPGQTLRFDAAVKNELDNRQAEGLLWTESSPALSTSQLKPQTFRLRPQQEATVSGSLQVVADASGTHAITQVAGALIENLAVESDSAALWLPFDDTAAAFTDRSGSLPPHDGACYTASGPSTTACPLEPAGGRSGGGMRLSGTGYVEVPLNVSETSYAVSLWFRTTCTDCGIFSVDLGARGTSGHDRHLYLSGGNICARIWNNEIVCTPGLSLADDQWHHVVHTFGGTQGGQKIYVDGVLAVSGSRQASDFTTQDGINIGFANDAVTDYFTGSIDDVRVFGKALAQAEVRELSNLTLFQANFDRTDAWTDSSSFKTSVTDCIPCISPLGCPASGCRAYYGPAHTTVAVRGNAASFDGTQYLSVGGTSGAPQLDLSAGRFTISAWIYPRLHGDTRDTHTQGILGLNSGTAAAYPSLQRVGKRIRFSMGTGSAWAAPFTSGDVLTENQWNHVVVTLNKDEGLLRLYVNGELKGEPAAFTAVPQGTARSFELGRTSNTATLNAYGYWQGNQGDGPDCQKSYSSEMCMAIDGQEVWNEGDLDCTEYGTLNTTTDFVGATQLVLFEDDGGDRCGSGPTQQSNDDDHCQVWWGGTQNYDKSTSPSFNTTMASFSGRQYDFNSCGEGHFHMTLTNNSVPFYGSMDEVRIYGQALDEESIRELYLDAATLLRLPLDDAPGAVAFEDRSLARVPASCAASGCPVPGTTGRINRAAYFDSGKGSAISLSHSAANELVKSFTVAAWIRPSTVSPVQNIVSTSRAKSNNGWGFRLNGSNLEFEQYGFGVSVTASLGLQADRWHHVIAVVDETNHVAFYLNGAKWTTMSHGGTYAGAPDTDDVLLVGATQALNASTTSQYFGGQIDDVWVFNTPLSQARITQLYDSAPALHLLFDEATGATQFADNAADDRSGACTETATTSCPVTGEGVRGQIGLAARFDGVKDSVAVPSFGSFTTATVSAWVYRTGATTARETIVSYKENGYCGLVLDLNNDGSHQYPTFHVRVHGTSGTDSWKSVTAALPVPLNTWVHLAGTYDGNKLRLYQNGVLQTESVGTEGAGTMVNTCSAIMTVGSHNTQTSHRFPGAIDEVQMYSRALLPGQINDLYQYQSAWVEGRQSKTITVDNEAPTANILIGEGTYLANQAIWVGITANDATSGVSRVEMAVAKDGGSLTWHDAARCTDNIHQPEGAWCGQFDPPDAEPEGAYTLYARATDRVGRTGAADIAHIYVDDRAPVLDQVSFGLKPASQSKKQQSWIVQLSGPTKDLPLVMPAPSLPGSGIPEDGVRVTLLDSDNRPLGGARQTATVAGGKWSIEYTIRKAEPDGCYTAVVEAEDKVARFPGLNSDQVTRHTAVLEVPVVLEASAPQVLLDHEGIAGGRFGPGTSVLSGETTHRPVPVEVAMTGATGAEQTQVRLTCQHGNEGSWYTIFDLNAGTVKAGGGQTWDGEIHHWSTCRAEFTTSAPAGGVSGVINVCGTKIAEWTGDFAVSKTVEFVVHSDACGSAGCAANSPVTGVAGVDSAFRSVLPGSAFLNETPPANEVLHLAFEDILDAGGLDLRDVSGSGVNGSCSSGGCPKLGQVGPSGGAAWFDGVDDYVQVADDDRWDFASGQDFTVAVWARPDATQPDSKNTDHAIVEKWSGSSGYPYVIRYLDVNNKTSPGKVSVARYQGTQPQPGITSDRAINDGRYHHLAFVKAGTTLTLYVDGTPAGTTTDNTTGVTTNSSALFLGKRGPAQTGSNHFAGMIDDVRIFSRALAPADVKALYAGSGPLLVLPFEQAQAGEGDTLSDASGWGHHGTLVAGAGDGANKAVNGQVQSYALSLDGVDDYVNLGSDPGLKLTTSGTLATWIYPTAAKTSPVLAREGEYEIYRYADGTIQWAFANTTPGWNFVNTGYVAQANAWTHLAVVYDGGIVRTYADGALVHSYAGAGAIGDIDTTRNELWIGHRPGRTGDNFAGYVDDTRVYGRALPPEEIADLYNAGWRAATLPAAGVGAERSTWSTTVPAMLEGSYQIEMRGRDGAGHVAVAGQSSPLWRGEVDNLAPRARLSLNPTTNQYTAVAEDFNLAESGFNSPCGAGVVTARDYFRSPWYLGSTGDATKLYRLTATCAKPTSAVAETVTACDSFGNCATCSISGSCTTSVAAVGSAGQAREDDAEPDSGRADIGPRRPADFDITIPAVITATRYYEPRTVDVAGLITTIRKPSGGPRDLASVRVAIGQVNGLAQLSQPDPQRPYTVTWTFPWHLPEGLALPDGVTYKATVVARDVTGRTTTETQAVTVDVVTPAPVDLRFSGNGIPLESGATIREPSPDLALTWTPSSDGSGLSPYMAAFRVEDASGTTIHTSLHNPTSPLEAHITGGEAQFIRSGLLTRDVHGNERWQVFGNVVVDGVNTPDYIAPLSSPSRIVGADGEEWMTSGCTLLGADRRISRRAGGGWPAQVLYGTWDQRAVRLAWTGANWTDAGDLFVYLDTQEGGAGETFVPGGIDAGGTTVTLPDGLTADYLVWVQDAGTASLLHWEGAWVPDRALTPEQFGFDGTLHGGQTDLYLPFDLIGLSAGAPLGVLAFAADESVVGTGLEIWATLPRVNPVNSDRVNLRLPLAPTGSTLALLHAFRWPAVGDGICPNGTNGVVLPDHQNDTALLMTVESEPPGAGLSGIAGGLYWVGNANTDLSGQLGSIFGFLRPARTPLPDGQRVSYRVTYRNSGTHTLEGAWLELNAFAALRLGADRVQIGDIRPGAEGAVTFEGTVDRSLSPYGVAVALARLRTAGSDVAGPPLEWLIAAHRVDRGSPDSVGLHALEMVMGPRGNWLAGYSSDESGVSRVEVEITAPSGIISTFMCEVSDSGTGDWSCPWDASAANGGRGPADGDLYSVRVRATDRYGQTSPWSAYHTIRIDAKGPVLTLGAEAAVALANRVVRGSRLRLTGGAEDSSRVAGVSVCLEGGSCQSADLHTPGTSASRWSRWIEFAGPLDYVTKTVTIRSADGLGNRMGVGLELPVVVDNVPPVLTATQPIAQTPLGSKATVLHGTASDGGPHTLVWVRVEALNGEVVRLPAARDGEAWWATFEAESRGPFTLWVDAEDAAGNTTTEGPFALEVTCTDAQPVLAGLGLEPAVGRPMSIEVTAVISNTGPDPLPAGIPMLFADGTDVVGTVTTTIALPAGESQALSFVWDADVAEDYALVATVDRSDSVLPAGPLCSAPPPATFAVSLRDRSLSSGWELVSASLSTSNPHAGVMARGIDAAYTAILGYGATLRAYYPDRPEESTLETIDGWHGYWIKTTAPQAPGPGDEEADDPAGTWRIAGVVAPEDHPLPLAADWNLAGYLPRATMPVTAALASIAGDSVAVLGFDRTGLSYYPDLAPESGYNTLETMEPGDGYWIKVAQAVTLTYPLSDGTPAAASPTAPTRLNRIRAAEMAAGVQPTYRWLNVYGQVFLPDGSPAPVDTPVTVLADGVVCGATLVTQAGRFGLLACYADDQTTPEPDGARPDAVLTILVDGQPAPVAARSLNGLRVQRDRPILWTVMGDRWEVVAGSANVVDLTITKSVAPFTAAPGDTVQYTITFSNTGALVAQGVVMSDLVPPEITDLSFTSTGATVTPRAGNPFIWDVEDLSPAEGGVVTITGVLAANSAAPAELINTARVTAPDEAWPDDNEASAILHVRAPQKARQVYLPLLLRSVGSD